MDNERQEVSAAERGIDAMLEAAHLAAPHELPALVAEHAAALGAANATMYLSDLQQIVLVPFVGAHELGPADNLEPLLIDSTLAGRSYQHIEVLTSEVADGVHVWLPLLDGTERVGVLGVMVENSAALSERDGLLDLRLQRFASLVAELVVTKTAYSDTIVRLRRRSQMGLAAEMQWSLLPPLTFACEQVVIAGALEPAYEVAGDSVDYAVEAGRARVGIFDGMGHGLQSAQLASLSVAAYRNARRSGRSLLDTASVGDEAVHQVYAGEAFATAVLAELDTDTGELVWINAGHPEPLLLRDGRLIKTLHVAPALPFGLGFISGETHTFSLGSEQLEPGDRVLFYTDGVVEARSPGGDFFGVDRLVDLLVRNFAGSLPAPETMRRVVRALLEHQEDQLTDDATLLMLEWRSGRQQRLLPSWSEPASDQTLSTASIQAR